MSFENKLGGYLRYTRKGQDLTLAQVCRLVRTMGGSLSLGYLSRIELGAEGAPSDEILRVLALALHCEARTLFEHKAEDFPNSEPNAELAEPEIPENVIRPEVVEALLLYGGVFTIETFMTLREVDGHTRRRLSPEALAAIVRDLEKSLAA
jgi:transcriptional regulator with XRE-family HTH domain